MATTRLIPMHTIKNQSVAYTVHERIDYAINPNKSLGGELVTAYGCDPATAASEMMLTKREYAAFTGKDIWVFDFLVFNSAGFSRHGLTVSGLSIYGFSVSGESVSGGAS